ncbi:MAG: putative ABC transporter ATP-binding protein [Rhodanobacteraceae bacterium]
MTHPFVTLDRVSYALPDGRRLFSGLNLDLDARRTALVGRNGVGKSILAELVAGQRVPATGQRVSRVRTFHLPQRLAPAPGVTVAALAGVSAALDALARIEAGGIDECDFDLVAGRWGLRQRVRALLDRHGLGHLRPEQSADTVSGGEQTRVALLGAWLAEADVLVLDEPTNHLDRVQRAALRTQLLAWNGGLLVVSHDRALLHTMERILELDADGLHDYPGDYASYRRAGAAAQRRAEEVLARRKLERRRGEAELRAQRERQERRAARGSRSAREANQAPILLGMQKQRSEASAGRLERRRTERRAMLQAQVAEAARNVGSDADIVVFTPAAATACMRRALVLDGLVLPRGAAGTRPLDLVVHGGQRIGVVGENGSGKSTLLHVLAGRLAPLQGRCEVAVPFALLDQTLELLSAECSVLQQLNAQAPGTDAASLRSRLALLGFDASAVARRPCQLSGGERLKAALAVALYRDDPAGLLLLDEPDNHLDLAALGALERMLQQYRGALVVVSHDEAFLDALSLDTRIETGPDGWRVSAW